MKTLKTILFSAVMAFALVLTSCAQKGENAYSNVKVTELKEHVGSDDAIILDIRTPEEVADGYVEGAKRINFYDENFMSEVEKLDKDAEIYVYCHSGGRSAKASQMMADKGFKHVHNVEGGITAWKGAKYPTVK